MSENVLFCFHMPTYDLFGPSARIPGDEIKTQSAGVTGQSWRHDPYWRSPTITIVCPCVTPDILVLSL